MKYLKLFLAFGMGWLTVITMGFAADTFAQRGKNGQQASLKDRISALEARVILLEQLANKGLLGKKVTAPFEVTDGAGKRIFYVSPDRDVEFYRGGKRVAMMSAGGGQGTFWVLTESSKSYATLTGERLTMTEDDKPRLELGRSSENGNYRLLFFSKDGAAVSGIGEANLGSGLAFVGDLSGHIRARIHVLQSGIGAVDVLGDSKNLLTRLTEGERQGGLLIVCSTSIKDCNPPVVVAGDGGGFGVVGTGPLFRLTAPGFGTPGSFIEGKH